jgi:hypothetical protein
MKKKINIDKERKAIRTFEGIKPFNIKFPYVPEFILNNKEVETPEFLKGEKNNEDKTKER